MGDPGAQPALGLGLTPDLTLGLHGLVTDLFDLGLSLGLGGAMSGTELPVISASIS